MTWMQRLLRSTTSPLLIDVGGNIGFYTLAAAAVNGSGANGTLAAVHSIADGERKGCGTISLRL